MPEREKQTLPCPANPVPERVRTVLVLRHQSGDVAMHESGRIAATPEAASYCCAKPLALSGCREAVALAFVLDKRELLAERTAKVSVPDA